MVVSLLGGLANAIVSVNCEDDNDEPGGGDEGIDNGDIPMGEVVCHTILVGPGVVKHNFKKVSN